MYGVVDWDADVDKDDDDDPAVDLGVICSCADDKFWFVERAGVS